VNGGTSAMAVAAMRDRRIARLTALLVPRRESGMTSGERPTSWISKTSTLVTAVCTIVATVIGYFTLAAAVKWPPFHNGIAEAESRQVDVFKGDGCSDGNNCAHIGVELTGFPADSEVICNYESSVGSIGFTAELLKTDRNGRARKVSTNRFWDPSGTGWVAVTCDNIRGVLQRW